MDTPLEIAYSKQYVVDLIKQTNMSSRYASRNFQRNPVLPTRRFSRWFPQIASCYRVSFLTLETSAHLTTAKTVRFHVAPIRKSNTHDIYMDVIDVFSPNLHVEVNFFDKYTYIYQRWKCGSLSVFPHQNISTIMNSLKSYHIFHQYFFFLPLLDITDKNGKKSLQATSHVCLLCQ